MLNKQNAATQNNSNFLLVIVQVAKNVCPHPLSIAVFCASMDALMVVQMFIDCLYHLPVLVFSPQHFDIFINKYQTAIVYANVSFITIIWLAGGMN